jgi:uncharacterized flavoprotein (TIGR03862 family)
MMARGFAAGLMAGSMTHSHMPAPAHPNRVVVVGGGPAGLRAAEVARAAGAEVVLCEGQRSVGHKFLVAGRGGLNLTHGESVENFPERYGAEHGRWRDLLQEFGPGDLQNWAANLGVETYVGSSGRVFPRGQKAAALLRAWTSRLREASVEFRMDSRLVRLERDAGGWNVGFANPEGDFHIDARGVVLALGGASWPETGSDGVWPQLLTAHGIEVTPWAPANCGWNVDWPPELLARVEGLPLKNLTVTVGPESVSGELLITRYGIEGGAIYRVGRLLRAMAEPGIEIDLKPQLSEEAIALRLEQGNAPNEWSRILKLSPAATALLESFFPDEVTDRAKLVARVKQIPLCLRSPRPIAEAISSAGGIAWRELDEALMVTKMPGVFAAGEMIDWEAPTGGYLLQGCFSTGTRAGQAAARWTTR